MAEQGVAMAKDKCKVQWIEGSEWVGEREEDGDAVDRGTAVEKDGSEREKMEAADGTKKR